MLLYDLAKRIGIGLVIATLLAVAGYYFLWLHPERVNSTASGYLDRANRLGLDSTNWVVERGILNDTIASRGRTIAKRDSLLRVLQGELKSSIQYGQEWESRYTSQVAVSDANADRLSESERQLAYFRALQRNGTLSPLRDVATLQPEQPDVVAAGLKTASREAIGAGIIDSLGRSVDALRRQNKRLGDGLQKAGATFAQIGYNAQKKKKGGLWPFNKKRRKQLDQVSEEADKGKAEVDKVSDLERELLRQ